MFAGNIIYSADMLEQVISVADKWWSNVGQKEALSIILATGAPGPNAPTVVRISPVKQTRGVYILTLCSLSSS